MSDALDGFFSAWSETDPARRRAQIAGAMDANFRYSDPRHGNPITDLDELSDYVGMFSANAPGWRARVEASDIVERFARAVVAFEGPGPDGVQMTQHGTYFAELSPGGKVLLLVGFVGKGVSA